MYTKGSVDKRRTLITLKDKGQLCDYASRWNLNQACSQPLVKGGSTSLIFGLGGWKWGSHSHFYIIGPWI